MNADDPLAELSYGFLWRLANIDYSFNMLQSLNDEEEDRFFLVHESAQLTELLRVGICICQYTHLYIYIYIYIYRERERERERERSAS